jgi:putative colanic acid biosynthesis acetyltransferase WcaF
VWKVVYMIFFRYSLRNMHSWRSFILRLFGAQIGVNVHVYPKVTIWAPWNLIIGDETGIADGVTLYSQGIITIGRRSVISQGAHLVTGTHDYNLSGFPLITKPINIGDNVWVATESFVHPGVDIGSGCVVGARSVVIKSLPEWTICAGNPCKVLKPRQPILS